MAEDVKENEKIDQTKKTGNEKKKLCIIAGAGALVFLVLLGALVSGLALKKFAGKRNKAVMGRTFERGFGGKNLGGRGMMKDRGGMMQNRTAGKVTAVNDKQFTIDVSGTSKTIQITDSTRFPVNSSSSINTGDQVIVTGEQNSNGVIQAERIIVNPTLLNK